MTNRDPSERERECVYIFHVVSRPGRVSEKS